MSKSEQIQEYLSEYLAISRAWHGLYSGMTLSQGLRILAPIISQNISPSLSRRARQLTREIIGTGHRHYTRKEAI